MTTITDTGVPQGTLARYYDITPQRPTNGLKVVEVFAGGGLMAVGLKAAGYDLVWANDFNKAAVASYQHNLGDHIVHGDITKIDVEDIPDADVIAGGPPCQDFSVAGRGDGEEGERGRLVWTYLNVIERKRPKAFVFENVKGLVSKRHKPTFDALIERFESLGYDVYWRVINAWDYGVAQKRERVFIVGIRSDLNVTFEFPTPTDGEYRTQTLRDAIGDLPDPTSNHDPQPLSDRVIERLVTDGYGDYLRKHPIDVMDELARAVRSQFAKGAPNGLFYPDNHVRKDISDKALEGYERRGGQGGFGLRVNEWEEPSPTIFGRIANEGKAFVHPSYQPSNHVNALFDNVGNNPTWEHANREADLDAPAPTRTEKDRCDGINPINGRPRRFTVRECLRLQSVPDWYVIPDGISLSAQYRIVGNGVASKVAYEIGIALERCLMSEASGRDVTC